MIGCSIWLGLRITVGEGEWEFEHGDNKQKLDPVGPVSSDKIFGL